jgi:LytS/YehU family sensor histidine kinase
MRGHAEHTNPESRPRLLFGVTTWTVIVGVLLINSISSYGEKRVVLLAENASWMLAAVFSALGIALGFVVALVLTRRYPIGPYLSFRNIGVHTIVGIAYGAGFAALDFAIEAAVFPVPEGDSLTPHLIANSVGYWVFAAMAHGIEYLRRYRHSRIATLRARSDLADVSRRRAESELRALKAELNPHFLSTALRSASSLIRDAPAGAEQILAQTGDALRAAISRVGDNELTFEEEIDRLAPFLALERAQLDGQLDVSWQISDGVRQVYIPRMVLQPIIEIVIRHGFGDRRSPRVEVSALRAGVRGEQLRVDVSSAGAADRSSATTRNTGDAAFAHLQARLRDIYSDAVSLELETSREHGATARLILPWREAAQQDWPEELPAPALGEASDRRPRTLRMLLATWFVGYGTLVFFMQYDRMSRAGVRLTVGEALSDAILNGVYTTAIMYVAIRLTRSEKPWRAHAMAAVCLTIVAVLIFWIKVTLSDWRGELHLNDLVGPSFAGLLFYSVVAGIAHAVKYARGYHGSEAEGLRLRLELADTARRRAEAELRALKAELNPHFLGNAMGAVASLVRPDPAAAERMLAELDGLLRDAIARVGTQEVTLGEEIDCLAPFLALERARFGDRLVVSWVVDADALDARVPHLILQPLGENAVKHGHAPRGGPGQILVSGHRAGSRLELAVRDNGVGLRQAANAGKDWRHGVGLANARARLTQLYGSEASLDLESDNGGGTTARLTLPYLTIA